MPSDNSMPEAWDRLITEMLRLMIREFLFHPAEFFTFRRLAHHLQADSDVLHAIAEQRPDLFLLTPNDRVVKLFPEAVQRIVEIGIDRTISETRPIAPKRLAVPGGPRCDHFLSDDDILSDLRNCSFTPDALTRTCCWTQICRIRGANPHVIASDSWTGICRIRGYLLARQNPRGF